jgi:hypothetical protein
MARKFILLNLAVAFIAIFCSCSGGNNRTYDARCPELVEKAEYYNSQVSDGPMGMKMSVEYVDSVYRIIQIIDETQIPVEKAKMAYGNMKQNAIASISSAKGKERSDYQMMVDYHVSFEHLVKSKNTDEVIVRTIVTPEEIAEALSHELTQMDELRMWAKNAKSSLPREMEAGYIMKDISCSDDIVTIEIEVDEGLKDFDEATKIRQWAKVDQAVTLADLTTGLTFHAIASNVPVGINYHFVGSKGSKELTIAFSADEVVQYNDVMEKIKKQQHR